MTNPKIPEPMGSGSREYAEWVSLPPLDGGLWVAMVTEVLDDAAIPNLVKTDLASGGVGMVIGTTTLGKLWRIQVPREYEEEAMAVFESLMGDKGEASDDNTGSKSE